MKSHQLHWSFLTATTVFVIMVGCAAESDSKLSNEFKTDATVELALPSPDVNSIPSHDIQLTIREHHQGMHETPLLNSLVSANNSASHAFSAKTFDAQQAVPVVRDFEEGFWIAFWESGRAQVVGASDGSGAYTMQLQINGPLDPYDSSQWLTLRKVKLSQMQGCRLTADAILTLPNIGPVINPAIFALASGVEDARQLQLNFDVTVNDANVANLHGAPHQQQPEEDQVPDVYIAQNNELIAQVNTLLGRSRRLGNMDNLVSFIGSHCFDEVHRFARIDMLSFATNNLGVQSALLTPEQFYLDMPDLPTSDYSYTAAAFNTGFVHTRILMSMFTINQQFINGMGLVHVAVNTYIGGEGGIASPTQWLTFSAPH